GGAEHRRITRTACTRRTAMRLVPLVVAAGVLAAVAAVLVAASPPQAGGGGQTLEDGGVDPRGEGLPKDGGGRPPTPPGRPGIKGLAAQRASDNCDGREEASGGLAPLAGLARKELEEASRGKDPEVARRARDILNGEVHWEGTLLAALREVTRRQPPGAVPA